MVNLDLKIDNEILTIVVDLRKEYGDSQSGGSTVIANSSGNLRLCNPDGSFRDELLNLSLFRKKPRPQRRLW